MLGIKLSPRQFLDRVGQELEKVDPAQVQLFLVFYYVLTGLHAVHLTIGIAIMAVLAFMAWRSAFSSDYYTPVEMWGLYWHFVDIVWIFLLPLLYLIGTRSQLF